jgi:4-diphosphocytidyl-2-C-methyl-D-erythritol kinase
MSSRRVEVSAPGKINLVLRVLDRRSDGYHNLISVMQTVELADTISAGEVSGSSEIRLSCEGADLPLGPENLVYRAAQCVSHRLKRSVGLNIRLQKRLPVAAGVGGGSSDAAATIEALAVLFETGWSQVEMAEIGEELGSDVPFFFYAPTALVEGRGERVTSLRIKGERWLVLVNPGIAISTAWAYGKLVEFRRSPGGAPPSRPAVSPADFPVSWDQWLPLIENDFQTVIEGLYPMIRDLRLQLQGHGAEAAMLCGSGSSVFGIFSSEQAAEQAADTLGSVPGWRVWMTRTSRQHDPPRTVN